MQTHRAVRRVHIDVDLAGTNRVAQRTGLEARGAQDPEQHAQGPHAWYVMLDPEGNELCIARPRGPGTRPCPRR